MTMPHLMNCSHSPDGWCLDCVGKEHAMQDRALDYLAHDHIRSCSTCSVPHDADIPKRKCFHDRIGKACIVARKNAALAAARKEGE
jgi:hypothetical protein